MRLFFSGTRLGFLADIFLIRLQVSSNLVQNTDTTRIYSCLQVSNNRLDRKLLICAVKLDSHHIISRFPEQQSAVVVFKCVELLICQIDFCRFEFKAFTVKQNQLRVLTLRFFCTLVFFEGERVKNGEEAGRIEIFIRVLDLVLVRAHLYICHNQLEPCH